MEGLTRRLWAEQDRHAGDRTRLFTAVADAFTVSSVLYPGSFVDIAPSFVFDAVTYVDSDLQAARFFAATAGVDELIGVHRDPRDTSWQFVETDYTSDMDLPGGPFDLLVSLYAGFVSEHCTGYLRSDGLLLVNSSHGDAAMASIDPRHTLVAVVTSRDGGYRVAADDLDSCLIPKADTPVTIEMLHRTGRGIAYTRPAFAYVFERSGG